MKRLVAPAFAGDSLSNHLLQPCKQDLPKAPASRLAVLIVAALVDRSIAQATGSCRADKDRALKSYVRQAAAANPVER